MPNDFTVFLWALKLGAFANLYFLANTLALRSGDTDPHIVIPAQILFLVSGYRCLFPNRYEDNVVLHASPLSSTLVTRVLATFAEVAWIYQFSHVIRLPNLGGIGWVEALSWLMVFQVVISQLFVWAAISTGRLSLYFHEEVGWGVIFAANTIASAYLWAEASKRDEAAEPNTPVTRQLVASRLHRSLHEWNRATDAASWGGLVGLTWMTAYWATLIPMWVNHVVRVAATP